jgi:hypothetical protein
MAALGVFFTLHATAIVTGFIVGLVVAELILVYCYAIFSKEFQQLLDCASERQQSERGRHPKLSDKELFYFCMRKCQESGTTHTKGSPSLSWVTRTVTRSVLSDRGQPTE